MYDVGMSTTSEILSELQKALSAAEKAHAALETAKSKLEPLEVQAKDADNAVKVLVRKYESLTGDGTHTGRRGSTGPRKSYNITAESKIAATEKRQYTRAINSGKSEAEAKKAGKAAADALKKKLGVK